MSHYPAQEHTDGTEPARELSPASFSRGDALSLLGFLEDDNRDESNSSTSEDNE